MAGEMQMLYLAQFALQAGQASYEYQKAEQKAELQRQQAYQQAALNNELAFNAQLNLNSQQVLEMKKFGFDDFELKKSIRREQSKNAALKASFGGTFGQQGGSYDATINNINRQGYLALARKDFNFKTTLADFDIRHKNIQLETESKNNQAFSGLSTGGSLIGTGLQIASAGIQGKINSTSGTTSVK